MSEKILDKNLLPRKLGILRKHGDDVNKIDLKLIYYINYIICNKVINIYFLEFSKYSLYENFFK